MGLQMGHCIVLLHALFLLSAAHRSCAVELNANQTGILLVDASARAGRKMPDNMFGVTFEEINHAGAGGLWAEFVSNRGFEAGGPNTPSNIDPWSIIGNESYITISTDRTSCFSRNEVALRMEVLCDSARPNICPSAGVGVYNPGYWGMNIEQGKTYKVIMYMRSLESVNITISLTSSDGLHILASSTIITDTPNWTKVERLLESKGTNVNSRLQLTTTKKGVVWFDQVSVMPLDTYKGHGFRTDLVSMLENLKPRYIRFPGSLDRPKSRKMLTAELLFEAQKSLLSASGEIYSGSSSISGGDSLAVLSAPLLGAAPWGLSDSERAVLRTFARRNRRSASSAG